MDFLHWIFLITSVLGIGFSLIAWLLLQKMDAERRRMEDYLVAIGYVMADYYQKIGSLFQQSIHYYDDTIYQFVESTKGVKQEIDDLLDEYEDLREFIVPVQSPEEMAKEQEQKEFLGVVRNYPIRRAK